LDGKAVPVCAMDCADSPIDSRQSRPSTAERRTSFTFMFLPLGMSGYRWPRPVPWAGLLCLADSNVKCNTLNFNGCAWCVADCSGAAPGKQTAAIVPPPPARAANAGSGRNAGQKRPQPHAFLPIARYRASSSFLDDAATAYPEIVVKDEQELQIWRVVAHVVHTTREKTLSASVVRRTTLHAKRLALPEVLAYAGIDENWPPR
jgi:hypothetical protein